MVPQQLPVVTGTRDIRAARSARLNSLLGIVGPQASDGDVGLASTGLEAQGAGQACVEVGVGDVHVVASGRSPPHARSPSSSHPVHARVRRRGRPGFPSASLRRLAPGIAGVGRRLPPGLCPAAMP